MKEREINTVLKGIAAAPGIVIAKAYVYAKEKEEISNESITDIDEALKNLDVALELSKKELKKITPQNYTGIVPEMW